MVSFGLIFFCLMTVTVFYWNCLDPFGLVCYGLIWIDLCLSDDSNAFLLE